MRVVYIVLAHAAPNRLGRLVERLDHEDARFLVHIDKSAPQSEFDQASRRLSTNDRVTFARRVRSRRTSFGLVEVPLSALSSLAAGDAEFDYVILLSGQDYPIKSAEHIHAYLQHEPRLSFLHAFPIGDSPRSEWPPQAAFRYRNWHFWIDGLHAGIPLNRSIPGGLEPFGGSMFWALSREAALYVADLVDRNPSLVRFFRHTFVPDEMFFHTILMNSTLHDQMRTLPAPNCYGLHYIEWIARQDHPQTLGLADLPKLRSTPALFARKFDLSGGDDVLDAIDEELLGWPT